MNKTELGKPYSDTVFLGTGKFYLKVGLSSYKELDLTKNQEIIKKISSQSEISGTGIFYNQETNSLIFSIDGVPIVQNNNLSLNQKQELSDEQKEIALYNLGFISDKDTSKFPHIFYNINDEQFYITHKEKSEYKTMKFQEYLNSSRSSKFNIEEILKLINSPSRNIDANQFIFSIKDIEVLNLRPNKIELLKKLDLKKNDVFADKWNITQQAESILTIDKIITKKIEIVTSGGQDSEDPQNIPINLDFSELLGKEEEFKGWETVSKRLDDLFQTINKDSIIQFKYGQEQEDTIQFKINKFNLENKILILERRPKSWTDQNGNNLLNKLDGLFTFEFDINKLKNLIEEDLSFSEKAQKLKLMIPKCTFLRDQNNNTSNFDFISYKSNNEYYAFGGLKNINDRFYNCYIAKGSSIILPKEGVSTCKNVTLDSYSVVTLINAENSNLSGLKPKGTYTFGTVVNSDVSGDFSESDSNCSFINCVVKIKDWKKENNKKYEYRLLIDSTGLGSAADEIHKPPEKN